MTFEGKEVVEDNPVMILGILLKLSVPTMLWTVVRVSVMQSSLAEVSFKHIIWRIRG